MGATENITRLVSIERSFNTRGSYSARIENRNVVLTVNVYQIPEEGGKLVFTLPWGKIYGQMKKLETKEK